MQLSKCSDKRDDAAWVPDLTFISFFLSKVEIIVTGNSCPYLFLVIVMFSHIIEKPFKNIAGFSLLFPANPCQLDSFRVDFYKLEIKLWQGNC